MSGIIGSAGSKSGVIGTTELDYEEGTWTPVLNFNGGTTGIVTSTAKGKYTKIGRVVHCEVQVHITDNGSSTGSASISGLPFTVANDMNSWEPACLNVANFRIASNVSFLGGWADNNSTWLQLRMIAGTQNTVAAYPDQDDLGDTFYISGSITYHV